MTPLTAFVTVISAIHTPCKKGLDSRFYQLRGTLRKTSTSTAAVPPVEPIGTTHGDCCLLDAPSHHPFPRNGRLSIEQGWRARERFLPFLYFYDIQIIYAIVLRKNTLSRPD